MNADCVPCLGQAAREVLAPRRVVRVALLGSDTQQHSDIHLLVEFSPDAPAVPLTDWLRLQRELRERCDCSVELVSVTGLEEQVASDSVALTVLYDASADA